MAYLMETSSLQLRHRGLARPYYRKLTLHEIKVLEIIANLIENEFRMIKIDHFTVSCLVAWSLNESEAGRDLVLIETSLLFSC